MTFDILLSSIAAALEGRGIGPDKESLRRIQNAEFNDVIAAHYNDFTNHNEPAIIYINRNKTGFLIGFEEPLLKHFTKRGRKTNPTAYKVTPEAPLTLALLGIAATRRDCTKIIQ